MVDIGAGVERLVQGVFLGEQSEEDNNLQFVRDMLTLRAPGDDVLAVLRVYRQVWQEGEVADEELSLVKNHLKLAGVVKRQGRDLVVRNRVYKRVFDGDWLRKHWLETWWQRLKPALPLIGASLLVTIVMSSLGWAALWQAQRAEVALGREAEQRQVAEGLRQEAEASALEAQANAQKAEENALEAEQNAQEAEANALEAQRQTELALTQEQVAQESAAEAEVQAELAQQRQAQAEVAQQQAEVAKEAEADQRQLAEQRRLQAEKAQAEAKTQAELAQQQATVAKLREQAAVVQNWLPTRKAARALVMAIQTYDKSQTYGQGLSKDANAIVVVESSLLSAVQEAKEINLFNPDVPIGSVAFSPNGERIVSGSDDGTVRLWDLQGNQIGEPFEGHSNLVRSVAFSPNGERIVSGSYDGTVRLWDLQGNQIGEPFQDHALQRRTPPIFFLFGAHSVAFSPDGKYIVSGRWDGTLRLWHASPDAWLALGCNRLRHHPYLRTPTTAFPHNDGMQHIAQQARDACERRVWSVGGSNE
jgi:hypothetical protein